MPPDVSKSMKRKWDDVAEVETCGSERQSILNISMFKLKTEPERRVEPCLLRNVLILNTLKHIETELEMEGVCFSTPNNTALNSTSKLDLDPRPESASCTSVLHLPPHASHYMPSVAIEGPPSPMPKPVHDISARDASEKTVLDLVPCKLSSVCLRASRFPVSRTSANDCNNNLLPPLPSFSSGAPTCTTMSMSNEDVFGDIDVSVYDIDICSISSAMKFTPLSAEEVLHSFPGSCSGHTTDSFHSIINSQCGTSFRNENVMDELDNIMQILVGM